MTEKRFNFEQYLRDTPMPTKCLDNENYYIVLPEMHKTFSEIIKCDDKLIESEDK